MSNNELFGDRRKAQEDEYFYRQEQALMEKLRQRHQEEATRQRMAERSGVADEEILRDLQTLGFTPETVMLLHLVPLLQMAWAEGSVSTRERELIIEAARSRGIDTGSAADRQLTAWLDNRPSEELFQKTLRAVSAILESQPSADHDATQQDLLARLTAVASASGGILGFGKVSPQEQEVLARITKEMERARRK